MSTMNHLTDMTSNGNWASVSNELEKRLRGPRGNGFLAHVAETNSLAAQATIFGPVGVQPPVDVSISPEATNFGGGTVVRAFWWGFHVQFSHEDVVSILASADMINDIVNMIGGNIPSPAQPWIKLLAPFVAALHDGLRAIDKGQGIYVSMSWFAPGVFVPTSV